MQESPVVLGTPRASLLGHFSASPSLDQMKLFARLVGSRAFSPIQVRPREYDAPQFEKSLSFRDARGARETTASQAPYLGGSLT